ncbi:hypothetical protein BJY16_006931 [Actinoplanes octamycinicus]|uniref:Uncharacterized protein n=1 Tax=Actinoplanes octamycinicus TaxID=135948 RepID=A0A7W7H410_9ACTN|nr:hypothetical protein [Actinoplanes octamycinicus]MBB4743472.1 hypothetical protein [Actinoplanes octamycinicus]GIE62543.1 hypothetical protein Aoc01nite_79450 [Actinoplanes octamycinicus]
MVITLAEPERGILAAVEDWELTAAGGECSFTHVLVFGEDVRVAREDLMEGAVAFLATVPGVTAVEHVEREIVEITAGGVPAERIARMLGRWWDRAKRERKPWMVAMQARVATAAGLFPEFQRDGWVLTRVLDDEVTHVISLDHEFGRSTDEHQVRVMARVVLTVPDDARYFLKDCFVELGDAAGFAEELSGRVRPELAALSSVDGILEQAPPGLFRARALLTRGRVAEAWQLYQADYERQQPRHRPYSARYAERLGVPPLETAADPRLSRTDEATLIAWQTGAQAWTQRLRELTGLPLDGSPESLDELWAWLRVSADRLRTGLAGAEPVFAARFYPLDGAGRRWNGAPFEPWYRATVELVTAYLGAVVIRSQPGTVWGIADDGGLALLGRSGTGLLDRVFMIVWEAFDAPEEAFDPRRLRRLHGDMVRWTTAERGHADIITVRV